jgi:diacylglycerol kinase (ATP)
LIAVFINPLAGRGKSLRVWEQIEPMLMRDGISYAAHQLEYPESLSGFTGVLVIGGDGTLNHLVNRYPGLHLPIGIIPAGSGNDLASSLFSGTDLGANYRNALSGTPRLVDAGTCNGKVFLNGVGIGFDGEVALDIPKVRWWKGKAKYLSVVLRKIITYREKVMRIEWEGRVWERRTFMVSVANGYRYGGGFRVAPLADWQDGQLDVVIIGSVPIWKRFRYLPVIEKGKHLDLPFVDFSHAREISISSSHLLHAHMDGERMSSDRFDIRMVPGKFLFRYD